MAGVYVLRPNADVSSAGSPNPSSDTGQYWNALAQPTFTWPDSSVYGLDSDAVWFQYSGQNVRVGLDESPVPAGEVPSKYRLYAFMAFRGTDIGRQIRGEILRDGVSRMTSDVGPIGPPSPAENNGVWWSFGSFTSKEGPITGHSLEIRLSTAAGFPAREVKVYQAQVLLETVDPIDLEVSIPISVTGPGEPSQKHIGGNFAVNF